MSHQYWVKIKIGLCPVKFTSESPSPIIKLKFILKNSYCPVKKSLRLGNFADLDTI